MYVYLPCFVPIRRKPAYNIGIGLYRFLKLSFSEKYSLLMGRFVNFQLLSCSSVKIIPKLDSTKNKVLNREAIL